jgi:hypothetical protein
MQDWSFWSVSLPYGCVLTSSEPYGCVLTSSEPYGCVLTSSESYGCVLISSEESHIPVYEPSCHSLHVYLFCVYKHTAVFYKRLAYIQTI